MCAVCRTSYYCNVLQIEFAADQISTEWLDDLLVAARDSHRAFERSHNELEDVSAKCLALKKVMGSATCWDCHCSLRWY